jgi:hypothetical protein
VHIEVCSIKNETVCSYMEVPSMYIKVRFVIDRLCISKCVLLKMKLPVHTCVFILFLLELERDIISSFRKHTHQ